MNNANDVGWTALHFAARMSQFDIFTYLLENGAELCLKDKHGQTILHLAAKLGSLKICKLIVEGHEGIDINSRDFDGETPIHIAVGKGKLEIVKFLFYKGGDLNSRVSSRANGGWRNGDTPLHTAARNRHTEIVKFILVNVVDKNPVNVHGQTPLFLAANNGHLETYRLICPYVEDPVPLDLRKGIFVTLHDSSNYFRLMQQAQIANMEVSPKQIFDCLRDFGNPKHQVTLPQLRFYIEMRISMTNQEEFNYFRFMQRAQQAQLELTPGFSPGF